MPLRRLSDVKRPNGLVPVGSMSKRVRLEAPDQEIWARVSIRGKKAEITIPYLPGVRANTLVAYDNHQFRIDHAAVLGSDEQICLRCTKAGNVT